MKGQGTSRVIERFLARISEYQIEKVIVFGSYARGEQERDSDLDLAIVIEGEGDRPMFVALDMSAAAYDILLEEGVNISPFPILLDEWNNPEKHTNPELIRDIAAEGMPYN